MLIIKPLVRVNFELNCVKKCEHINVVLTFIVFRKGLFVDFFSFYKDKGQIDYSWGALKVKNTW